MSCPKHCEFFQDFLGIGNLCYKPKMTPCPHEMVTNGKEFTEQMYKTWTMEE